jgi:hypothetical protein
MKKQLPTETIANELAGSSIFFHAPAAERPSEGASDHAHDRTVEQPVASTPAQAPVRPVHHLLDRTTEPVAQASQERPETYPSERSRPRIEERATDRTGSEGAPREKAERYSFEIYPSQKEEIEEYVYHYKRRTGKKLSASKFIRDAIDYYFHTLNRHGRNR